MSSQLYTHTMPMVLALASAIAFSIAQVRMY